MEAVAETERSVHGALFRRRGILRCRDIAQRMVLMYAMAPSFLYRMGSSTAILQGVYNLLDDIVKYVPEPGQRRNAQASDMKTNGIFEADYDFSKAEDPHTIFKTIVDPFIGKYSLIKVCSGVIKTDDTLYNQEQDMEEKLEQAVYHAGQQAD